ncbi:MAG: type I DNA topoisomerase [Candidatus Cloacimonetes bacterium]|nr:type I DNA topoisomerase [Candidatus Cloacimonadota bacterium]
MSQSLIIVESPAKARTLSKFLGNQYVIKASMGHVRDLPKSDIGVDIENGFKPKYVVPRTKRDQKVVKDLREAAKSAEAIYLASDHDREGEAIAWHLANVLKKEIGDKPLYRIVFNEITRQAIVHALEEPGKIDQDKVDAQQARRILDRLVGYKISPILWRVITTKLSAGRVQSVALRLICEREDIIDAFVPEEYWTIDTVLHKGKLPSFKAGLKKWDGENIRPGDKAAAAALVSELEGADFSITDLKRTTRTIQPSPPYITSTLQQEASRVLGFSAKRTMAVAQQLYEGIDIGGDTVGLITYMRTDSLRIANEALETCRQLVQERFGADELHDNPRVYKNKSSAQDAHEAIRPTDSFRTPERMKSVLSAEQIKLYTLIWQRFVATQMRPAKLQNLALTIQAGRGSFAAQGSTITQQGFIKAFPHTILVLGENIDAAYAKGDALEVDELTPNQHFTKPPARYSEASLIRELEAKGIGRPSTYAQITNTIVERTYVELLKKRFHPTILGRAVNRFLVGHFDKLFNVSFTAELENKLDEVEYGRQEWHKLLEDYWGGIGEQMDSVDLKEAKKQLEEPTELVCEKCGSPMIIKWSKNGQILACSNFPECSNIKNFTRDAEGKVTVKEDELIGEKCPKCGEELVLKSGKFGEFISCSNYPKCKYTRNITTGIKCPECGEGELAKRMNKRGKPFWGCDRYPKCKYISGQEPVDKVCPNCGFGIMQRRGKKGGETLVCPECKHEES